MQQAIFLVHRLGNLTSFRRLLGLAGLSTAIVWVALHWLSPYPAVALILILWVGALGTVVLPVRLQLLLFWALLPFVGLLKRLVFLDESAGTTQMYLVLATQDIMLIVVLLKLFLKALHSRVSIRLLLVDIAVGLFGIYSLLSAVLFSSNVPLTARLAAVESWVWPMAMYYLGACYLNRSKDINTLSNLIIGSAVIVALYGMYQFFGGLLPFEEAWFARVTTSINVARLREEIYRAGVFRTFATMDSHGTYGLFLGMGLILAWVRRFRLGIFLWGLCSLIIALGLILSFTRYTWIMPPIAAGFIVLFQYRKIKPLFNLQKLRQGSLLLLAVVGAFFPFYVAMSNLYGMQLISSSNPYLVRAFGTGTLYARLQWMSLPSLRNIGLLGKGLAAVGYFARKFGFETTDVNFHNIFVDMLDAMGVAGLGLFLWLLYLLFKRIIANIEVQSDARKRRGVVGLFSLILAMVVVSHFNGAVFYYGRAVPYYFWGLCGILAHYERENLYWSKT